MDAPGLVRVQSLVASSRAAGTLDTYAGPWECFQAWCALRDPPYVSLPAKPIVVALFLASVLASASSFSVVKAASAAIYQAHRMAGIPDAENPTSDAVVGAVRDAGLRALGAHVGRRMGPLFPGGCACSCGVGAPGGAG